MIPHPTRLFRSWFRRLADDYPSLSGIVGRIWNTYEHVVFTLSAWWYSKASTGPAPVDPYRLLFVDPARITHDSTAGFHFLYQTGVVADGDWDKYQRQSHDETYRYDAFRAHFLEGTPWEETDFYRRKVSRITGDEDSKFESIDALDRKCEELDRVWDDIRENGYRTQAELARSHSRSPSYPGDGGRCLLPWTPKSIMRHEIAVDVARDGELLLNEGRHRLCIAHLLGLDEIPVRVVARHGTWQARRNEVVRFLNDLDPAAQRAIDVEKSLRRHLSEAFDRDVAEAIEHPDVRPLLEGRSTAPE